MVEHRKVDKVKREGYTRNQIRKANIANIHNLPIECKRENWWWVDREDEGWWIQKILNTKWGKKRCMTVPESPLQTSKLRRLSKRMYAKELVQQRWRKQLWHRKVWMSNNISNEDLANSKIPTMMVKRYVLGMQVTNLTNDSMGVISRRNAAFTQWLQYQLNESKDDHKG